MIDATTANPAVTTLEWDTWKSFMSMRKALDLALERELQQSSEISVADYGVLISLFNAPRKQLRPRALGAQLGWEKSRVSHQVTRMASRGLVEKRDCDADARGTWVGMTPAGSRAVLGAMRGYASSLRENFFDLMTEDEIALFGSLADRVTERAANSCLAAGDCTE